MNSKRSEASHTHVWCKCVHGLLAIVRFEFVHAAELRRAVAPQRLRQGVPPVTASDGEVATR